MGTKKLKIMVSSTVYGAESDLDQIRAVLTTYGYHVIMSKEGSVYVPPGVSAEAACLRAVEECDLFLGIIFPRYGSGITAKEFDHAIQLNKPRWFLAHDHVTFAREILKQYMFLPGGQPNTEFKFRKTGQMDSTDVIHMYNRAISDHLPFEQRRSNWAQHFYRIGDAMVFLETQFKDVKRCRKELKEFESRKS